jgi:hypothetical protein
MVFFSFLLPIRPALHARREPERKTGKDPYAYNPDAHQDHIDEIGLEDLLQGYPIGFHDLRKNVTSDPHRRGDETDLDGFRPKIRQYLATVLPHLIGYLQDPDPGQQVLPVHLHLGPQRLAGDRKRFLKNRRLQEQYEILQKALIRGQTVTLYFTLQKLVQAIYE